MGKRTFLKLIKRYRSVPAGYISVDCDKTDNKELNRDFYLILVGLGYSITSVKDISQNKDYLIVFDYQHTGTLEDSLMKLSKKYNQEYKVLSSNEDPLIFTEQFTYNTDDSIYVAHDSILKKQGNIWTMYMMNKNAKSIMEQLDKDLKDGK
jgi:hypothetical protein